jgi:hypothetical protein
MGGGKIQRRGFIDRLNSSFTASTAHILPRPLACKAEDGLLGFKTW